MVEFAVLADPFWGRLPWVLKRRGGKHSKHRKFGTSVDCARVHRGCCELIFMTF